jgi:hypothetical protein
MKSREMDLQINGEHYAHVCKSLEYEEIDVTSKTRCREKV